MQTYNIIAEQEHTTVMAHYEALPREDRGYQSEAELEAWFIKQLGEQGYERVAITKVLPPMPVFGGGGVNREQKKKRVLEKLTAFFQKYYMMGGSLNTPAAEGEKQHVRYDLDASSDYPMMAAEESDACS